MSDQKNEDVKLDAKVEEVAVDAPKVEEPKVEEVVVEKPAVEAEIKEAKDKSEVISAPKPSETMGLGSVANGAMGSTTFKSNEEKPKPVRNVTTDKGDTVAIHSTRNVTWSGVGKVYSGYNIVSKEAAAKWLTRNHVRPATPEEVANEYNK